jgi:hypothetical protein
MERSYILRRPQHRRRLRYCQPSGRYQSGNLRISYSVRWEESLFLRQLRYKLFATACFLSLSLAGGHLSVGQTSPKALRQYSAKIAACMPSDVRLEEVAVYNRGKNILVAEKLKSLNARCSKDRLVDRRRNEIRFFRRSCSGYPLPNYLEIQAEEIQIRSGSNRLRPAYSIEGQPATGST